MADEADLTADVADTSAVETTETVTEGASVTQATTDTGKVETLLDGALDAETEDAAEQEDWRARVVRLAGGDEAVAKRVARYSSEANYIKAAEQAHAKLRSGEVKTAPPKDAKPEEVAAWRKENGLPETVDDMLKAAPDPEGFVFGEADKPYLDSYAKAVLEANGTPDEVARGKAIYAKMMEQSQLQRIEADKAFHAEAMDALRDEFGSSPAMRAELNSVQNFMDSHFSEEAKREILGGRGASGNLLRNHPAFLRDLAALSRELNPAGALVPAGTANAGKAVESELEDLRTMLKSNPDAYWKNPKNPARFAELLEARDKMRSRAA
jgi:hypothetical protein